MTQLLSASTIAGDDVVNSAGESLGKIEELMIEPTNGQVEYAVLSFGGFLGMGEKLFAIPWRQLELQADEHRFMLNMPRERLEQAPGFDKNKWPDTSQRGWSTEIDQYYAERT
jgi:sporulation protein YlmC with PRC-barrel domain